MKKTLLILSVVLAPLASFAGLIVSCQGATSARALALFINAGKIVQVRVQNQGALAKAFRAQQVSEVPESALYSLSGLPGLMEVEKSVIKGQGGWLLLEGDRFDCDSI